MPVECLAGVTAVVSAETWLTLGIVGFLMSFVKSAFGLGSGALFVPVMVLFMDPKLAVVSTVPLMLLSGLMTIRTYWGRWHWPVLQPLVLATLAGVLAGSALLVRLPADIVRKLVGTAALLFAGTQLYRLLGTEIAAASDGDGAGWGGPSPMASAPSAGLSVRSRTRAASFIRFTCCPDCRRRSLSHRWRCSRSVRTH